MYEFFESTVLCHFEMIVLDYVVSKPEDPLDLDLRFNDIVMSESPEKLCTDDTEHGLQISHYYQGMS